MFLFDFISIGVYFINISEKCNTTLRNSATGCPLIGPGGPLLNSKGTPFIITVLLLTGPIMKSRGLLKLWAIPEIKGISPFFHFETPGDFFIIGQASKLLYNNTALYQNETLSH